MYSEAGQLISSFFVHSSQISLVKGQLPAQTGEDPNAELIDFYDTLRLSILLYHLPHLQEIIGQILLVLNSEQVRIQRPFWGEIRGQLDIPSYINKRATLCDIPSYDCLIQVRDYYTPENILFVYTLLTFYNELKAIRIPRSELEGTPQESEILNACHLFESVLKNAELQHCYDVAEVLLSSNSVDVKTVLISTVIDRINSQLVTNSAYVDLVKLYRDVFENPTLVSGDTHGVIYDTNFDDRLFEIWCLHKLGQILREDYGFALKAPITPLYDRLKKPIYTFEMPRGKQLEVYFQKGQGVLWDRTHYAKVLKHDWAGLTGNPDIIFILEADKPYPAILIEIKNRKKTASEITEESYKMLGYFANFSDACMVEPGPVGVIIFRSSDREQLWEKRYTSQTSSGAVMAITLEPKSDSSFIAKDIISFILSRLEINTSENPIVHEVTTLKEDASRGFDTSGKSEYEIEENLKVLFDKVHGVVLREYGNRDEDIERQRKELQNYFYDLWDLIDTDSQTFLAMAELLYHDLHGSVRADFAPSCIEYSRAVEKELNVKLLNRFRRKMTRRRDLKGSKYLLGNSDLTLGQIIFEIELCNRPMDGNHSPDFLNFIRENTKNYHYILNRLPIMLKDINVRFRRKAAHTQRLSEREMEECRASILGFGSKEKMLSDLLKAL